MARIELILGCMWSGKTTELIRRLQRYTSIEKDVLIINYHKDTRYGENIISTHSKYQMPAKGTDKLMKMIEFEEYQKADIIGIDEGQFFSDLYDFVLHACEKDHKDIIISALDGDSFRKPFGQIPQIIPLCDDIKKKKAMCMFCKDGTQASFTLRIVGDTKQELIGANDKFQAVCRKHYIHSNL